MPYLFMPFKLNDLSKLKYEEIKNLAQSILIYRELPSSKDAVIDIIMEHQRAYGQSEVVAASSLKTNDFVLQRIEVPCFHPESRIGWCKVSQTQTIDASDDDISNFFKGYENVFLSEQPHIEMVNSISSKMVYLELVSSLAVGNRTINCQTIVRAKVLPNFKFVRQIIAPPPRVARSIMDEAF
jgi:hypothetical protein